MTDWRILGGVSEVMGFDYWEHIGWHRIIVNVRGCVWVRSFRFFCWNFFGSDILWFRTAYYTINLQE